MALFAPFRTTVWALLTIFCWPVTSLAHGEEADDGIAHACGLESPDVEYVPLPGPRPHETPWRASEPALVRRESPAPGPVPLSGVPQTRVRAGALSGRTIYLSPGHGFYRSSPLGRWATQRGNTNGVVEDLVSLETMDQYLLPMLMGAGATVIPVREPDLNPRGVALDNGAAGYTEDGPAALFSDESPGWGPPPVPMGNGVEPFLLGTARVMTAAATATARATWAPRVPADGAYHVYVAWRASPDRVTDAHYVVRHAGGESHFRVNQRRHGGTWVLLGRFYFRAGAGAEHASVVALNDSLQASAGSVSLDAVRLGGGTGDVGDGTLGPLARPRSEECARYHVQYSGAPPAVFAPSGTNTLTSERNADVTARPRFAAWLHEDGEDAVYVAWHTNASTSGNVRGTEAYVYGSNPVDGRYLPGEATAGSPELARSLLDELTTDLRREIEPDWRVRSLRSANLGEVNKTHNPEMPSVLMEVAYHDNAQDAAWLKEPTFRRVAARAFLHGLIKYFAARDGAPVSLPPEPPVAVVARHAGAGRVEVKWAPPADPDRAVPPVHPATGYRVYQSADGLAWDEGTDTADTSFSLSLGAGTTRYFRVAALNAGGESFPSDVVGTSVGATDGAPRVLVINAFRALDATMARFDDLSAYDLGSPARLFLEAMNDGTSLRRHGDAVARHAVAFDGATSEALAAGLLTPVGYRVLDWFSGRGEARSDGPDASEQALLRTFVLGGGHLLLSGSRIASGLEAGSDEDRAFLADILQARPACGLSSPLVGGREGQLLADLTGSLLDDGRRGSFPVGATDVLLPGPEGTAALGYAGTDAAAAILASPGGQVLLLGVPFEGLVTPERRAYLMGAFLARVGVLDAPPAAPGAEETLPTDFDSNGLSTPGETFPCTLDRIPDTYGEERRGCGCGAGGGSGGLAVLLLMRLVQRRRTR